MKSSAPRLGLADQAAQDLGAAQTARAIFGELHEDRAYSIFVSAASEVTSAATSGVGGHGVDGEAGGDERGARGLADGADADAGERVSLRGRARGRRAAPLGEVKATASKGRARCAFQRGGERGVVGHAVVGGDGVDGPAGAGERVGELAAAVVGADDERRAPRAPPATSAAARSAPPPSPT